MPKFDPPSTVTLVEMAGHPYGDRVTQRVVAQPVIRFHCSCCVPTELIDLLTNLEILRNLT